MTEDRIVATEPTAPAVGEDQHAPAAPGLLNQLGAYWQQLHTESVQQLQLLTLEAQLAAESLVAIWLLALSSALLLIGLWLCLQLALWQGFQALGLANWQALLLAFVIQLLMLLASLWRIRYHSRFLRFNQTLQSLSPVRPVPADKSQ